MSTLKEPKSLLESTYLSKGTIGNVGMPAAPIAHYSLVVNSVTGVISGMVEIIQAIDCPSILTHVRGNIRRTGFGDNTMTVSLSGEYTISVRPPAIGTFSYKFSAHMDIDTEWNGSGGFSYGNQKVESAPVKSQN
jgi:hypothetical protein